MARKDKRTGNIAAPKQEKVVPESCNGCLRSKTIKPSWRLSALNNRTIERFRFPDDEKELCSILNSLKSFESQTIPEWRADRSNAYAAYSLEKCKDDLDSEVVHYMEDTLLDEIHRFRIGYKKRVYAIGRGRGVFELIWWDPKHEIYKLDDK